MYELVQAVKNTYYIDSPSRVGLYKLSANDACIIDSGNNRETGKRIKRILDGEGLELKSILVTHAHADHIGGNRYLESQYGCKIFAEGIECDMTRHTLLLPSLLYGANPPRELKHKFLLAEESRACYLYEEALPEGFSVIELPGHTPHMVGYKTPDGAAFIADCISSREALDKYGVGYVYDVEIYLQTLEKVKRLDAEIFIPSHAPVTENVIPLVQYNIQKVNELCECITEICQEPKTSEEILSLVFEKYLLTINFEQYALVGSTLRSYLTYLIEKQILLPYFKDNKLYFERL